MDLSLFWLTLGAMCALVVSCSTEVELRLSLHLINSDWDMDQRLNDYLLVLHDFARPMLMAHICNKLNDSSAAKVAITHCCSIYYSLPYLRSEPCCDRNDGSGLAVLWLRRLHMEVDAARLYQLVQLIDVVS